LSLGVVSLEALAYSKSKINKSGRLLASGQLSIDDTEHELNIVFDWWREMHLTPLTEVTLKLIEWLQEIDSSIIINQRLKRKPQIVKKIRRKPTMRLSQMRDLGGCRAIFDSNEKLEEALVLIKSKSMKSRYFIIENIIDYRRDGREESGYRALHIIVNRNGHMLEVQLRTKIQHKWAESIEQTSVWFGCSLKEGEGPDELIQYFKITSDAFSEVDTGKRPSVELVKKVTEYEEKIETSYNHSKIIMLHEKKDNVNYLRAMKQRELSLKGRMKNWILIFDWKKGHFVHWAEVPKNPEKASRLYSDYEISYPYEAGFEVVLIGSSDVESIQSTHSHYFGVESFEQILQSIYSIIYSDFRGLSYNAFGILSKLYSHGAWSSNALSYETLKNHYCRFYLLDVGLKELFEKELIFFESNKVPIYLASSRKGEIEAIVTVNST
jgi:ppGpp synthetase/RelA/SpoT-type nucleotidyltranferase